VDRRIRRRAVDADTDTLERIANAVLEWRSTTEAPGDVQPARRVALASSKIVVGRTGWGSDRKPRERRRHDVALSLDVITTSRDYAMMLQWRFVAVLTMSCCRRSVSASAIFPVFDLG